MKIYAAENVRNVVLISHEGAGKTSLVEAALFDTGAIGRLGKADEGTTVSDFEPDERERKISIGTAAVPVERRAERRETLIEAICETDDDLLTQYLEGAAIDEAELCRALRAAVIAGTLVPVLCGSATANVGLAGLLDAMVDLCPSPADRPQPTDTEGQPIDGHPAALVFKTVADPFGRRSYFRVYGGCLKADSHVWNPARSKDERVAQLFVMRGGQGEPVDELACGDSGAA